MTRLARTSTLLAAIAITATVLGACGGGGAGATSPAPPTTATSAPETAPEAAPATASSATQAPAASTTAAPAGGGGGGTAGVCDLVTAEELAGILGVPSVTLQVLAGPPDTCDIQSGDGAPLAATVLMTAGGSLAFDAWAASEGTRDMPGLGDRAVFVPASQLLLVLVGETTYSIAVFDDGARSEDERVELMQQIAAIAVGRM